LMVRGKAMAVAGGRRSPPPMRQTKPICPFWLRAGQLRSGDRDTRCEMRDTRRPCGRRAKQTQSLYMLWVRSCGALHVDGEERLAKNKANRPGRPRSVVRDRGYEIRDTIHEKRVHRVDAAPNKANFRGF
jgi:hypothetical protein